MPQYEERSMRDVKRKKLLRSKSELGNLGRKSRQSREDGLNQSSSDPSQISEKGAESRDRKKTESLSAYTHIYENHKA